MDGIISISDRKRQPIKEMDVEPLDLLPILNYWRAAEPKKYETMVAMILASADTTADAIAKSRRRKTWHR